MIREFKIPTTTVESVFIPDHILEGSDPVLDRVVNMWLEKRTFDFSVRLRDDLWDSDISVVQRAVKELGRLYDAAVLAHISFLIDSPRRPPQD